MGSQQRLTRNLSFCFYWTLLKIKYYTKVENTRRKLGRIVSWWKFLQSKAEKAKDTSTEPSTFATATDSLKFAKNDGCSLTPKDQVTLNILMKCNTSAFEICEPGSTNNNSVTLSYPCKRCKTTGTATAGAQCTDPPAPAKCNTTVSVTPQGSDEEKVKTDTCGTTTMVTNELKSPASCELNQAMIDHINTVCIPALMNWAADYKSCFSTFTDPSCSVGCQKKQNLYDCQKLTCENCNPSNSNSACKYQNCLQANGTSSIATGIEGCQCECFKDLPKLFTSSPGNKKFCTCLDCFNLASFERLVKERRNECLNPTANHDSGNFADCRWRGRETPRILKDCLTQKACGTGTITTRSPSSVRFMQRSRIQKFHKFG